jgi:hypothetical protein
MKNRFAWFAALLCLAATVSAEPYIAIDKGLQCSACHTHAAGAGKRTAYGNIYAQTEMPSRPVEDTSDLWTGQINRWLAVGGNLRARYQYTDNDAAEDRSAFDVTRGNIYIEASMLNDRLSVYFDQQIAPSSSINREAYVLLKGKKFRFTAGQFYLPYGLRLQDDSAFVRRVTGINLTNPDRGVQLGFESSRWSSALSVTNGSGGGSETDNGKQASFMTSYVRNRWRVGVSANHNDSDGGDRSMANIFGGLKTGPVAWLFEVDAIRDELPTGTDQDGMAGIVEANWRPVRGHNFKFSYEYFDPDTDASGDNVTRWSALYELTPFAFLQARFGARSNDGPPNVVGANTDVIFAELHGFF